MTKCPFLNINLPFWQPSWIFGGGGGGGSSGGGGRFRFIKSSTCTSNNKSDDQFIEKRADDDAGSGISRICSELQHDVDEAEEHEILSDMLPDVIQNLKDAKLLYEYVQFNKMVAEKKFPLENISFLMFIELVKLKANEGTYNL